MPVYEVASKGDTMLPSLDENKQDDIFKFGDLIVGPSEIYDTFTGQTPAIINRTPLGLTVAGTVDTGNNLMLFDIGYKFDIDNCEAVAIDIGRFSTFLTLGNLYTAWGIVKWYDSATAGSFANFNITGEGDHTAGAVESFFTYGTKTTIPGMAGAANATLTVTNSTIDRNGTLAIAYTGNDPATVSIEIIFDPVVTGYYGRMGRSQNALTSPLNASVKTYVTATDVTNHGTLYVSGSAGSLKTEKVFNAGARVGDLAKITYYYYTDSGNATKVTNTQEQLSRVTASDLMASS